MREAIGGRRLRVDPNCAWSVPDAIRMIHALEPFGIDWVEQPTTLLSVTAMRQVREAVHVPIAADQAVLTPADVYDFVRQRAADAIVLSPHEAGGLLAFRKAAAIAEAGGVPVCLHGQSVSGITDAAQHHLGLSTPNLTDGNQIMHQLLVEDLVSSPDLTPQEGQARPVRRSRGSASSWTATRSPAPPSATRRGSPREDPRRRPEARHRDLPDGGGHPDHAQGTHDARRGRRRDAAAQLPGHPRRRRRHGAHAVVPRRPRGRRRQGGRRLPVQLRHGVRHPPGSRPLLRHRARAAARHRRRDIDHGHPHGGRERTGHRPAGEAGCRRARDHRRRHAGAHAPAGDAGRSASPHECACTACRPRARRSLRSASRA